MALKVTQTAGLKVVSGEIVMFDSGCETIQNNTDFDECNSAVLTVADGTSETLLPIAGMEISKLMYLKSDRALKFKAVAPGGNVATTTEYTLTPNLASFLGFQIEALYISNDTGADANLIQGYIGVDQ